MLRAAALAAQQIETEVAEAPVIRIPTLLDEDYPEPEYDNLEWMYYWGHVAREGALPSPINITITGSIPYQCPELKWFNFDVYPHKIKMTNTGYTLILGGKWKTQRPYLEGGPFLEKHYISQFHFHWGKDLTEGCDHPIDGVRHPAEMQVLYFKAEYMTQKEALKHHDGVTMICYVIKYGVEKDDNLEMIIEGISRVIEANKSTSVGPFQLSRVMPQFTADYFVYWGTMPRANDEVYSIRWLVPRAALSASSEQLAQFRRLWNPFDEPILENWRPTQEKQDRHVFFVDPRWNKYKTLLPEQRIIDDFESDISPAYKANPWMLPPANAYMIVVEEEEIIEEEQVDEDELLYNQLMAQQKK